jgi:hypothetical protein
VTEAQRLAERKLQHLLGAWRERDLTRGELLTRTDGLDELGADTLQRDAERHQHPCYGTPSAVFAHRLRVRLVVVARHGKCVIEYSLERRLTAEDSHR